MIEKIFILFIALFSYNLFSAEKITVAVLPFSSANEEEGDTLASIFANELSKRKVYRVLTRNSQMEKVMKELNFQRNGLTDENTIIQIGRALNAQYVLAGNISKLGRNNVLIVSMINVETFENITGDSKSFRNIEDVIQFVPQIVNEITGTRGRTVVDIDIFGYENEKTVITSGDRASLEKVIDKRRGKEQIDKIENAILIDINSYIKYVNNVGPLFFQKGIQERRMDGEVTSLMIASAFKYNDLLKALVSVGADLDLKGKSYYGKYDGKTALSYCILAENLEGVSILLNAGASMDNRDDYLYDAVLTSNLNIVKLLVNKGIDVNYGKALDFAIQKQNVGIVKFLLLNDAKLIESTKGSINPTLSTAININYIDNKENYFSIIKLVLDAGTDTDIRDNRGSTPLIEAIKNGNVDLVKLLIEYRADVNYEDRSGKKPLYYALKIIGNSKNEIVKLLVNEGATE